MNEFEPQPAPAVSGRKKERMSNNLVLPIDVGSVSDGFHTFDELYDHRCALMVALMQSRPSSAWWSRLHDDGSKFDGWIIVGIDFGDIGTITYHVPESWANSLRNIDEYAKAPKWDGHTSADVVARLKCFIEACI